MKQIKASLQATFTALTALLLLGGCTHASKAPTAQLEGQAPLVVHLKARDAITPHPAQVTIDLPRGDQAQPWQQAMAQTLNPVQERPPEAPTSYLLTPLHQPQSLTLVLKNQRSGRIVMMKHLNAPTTDAKQTATDAIRWVAKDLAKQTQHPVLFKLPSAEQGVLFASLEETIHTAPLPPRSLGEKVDNKLENRKSTARTLQHPKGKKPAKSQQAVEQIAQKKVPTPVAEASASQALPATAKTEAAVQQSAPVTSAAEKRATAEAEPAKRAVAAKAAATVKKQPQKMKRSMAAKRTATASHLAIQVESDRNGATAEKSRKRLESMGLPVYVSLLGNGRWHLVRVGPFKLESEAQHAYETLKQHPRWGKQALFPVINGKVRFEPDPNNFWASR
uniref:SPOR domain-containing protein n=1 Tax=Magnetococcus massalia (strain MO-1) TaxID=451514 RepID=A0A1S7LF15_MAGMO|nr:exported protein of unknown function [Include Sporulation related domain] [Candidatus Magnetococcus massalia]